MANQVAARLKGDDYQHLYAWYLTLDLLRPGSHVARVCIEDEKAWSADDVTLQHTPESGLPDRFYQIKHHVNHSKSHSTASFIEHEANESSLLQKLFRTWRNLKAEAQGRPLEIHFISTWTWDSSDKLKNCIALRTMLSPRNLSSDAEIAPRKAQTAVGRSSRTSSGIHPGILRVRRRTAAVAGIRELGLDETLGQGADGVSPPEI